MVMSGLKYPRCKWADLPPPAQNSERGFFCPDHTSGPTLVFSDGTKWRAFAKNGFFARKVAGASGLVEFTYAVPFLTKPVISVTLSDIPGGAGRLTYDVPQDLETVSGCTVKVKRGGLLPATLLNLSALLNFDVFGGGSPNGVIVNLLVTPET